jgi:hypothetical protein
VRLVKRVQEIRWHTRGLCHHVDQGPPDNALCWSAAPPSAVCASRWHTWSTSWPNGMTPAQIVEELPDLQEEDVHQAPAYAAALAQDELHPLRA